MSRPASAPEGLSLEPSPVLFHTAVAFCLAGLSSQFALDLMRDADFMVPNDLFSYAVFGVTLLFYVLGRIGPGKGLLVYLMETLRNLYAGTVWTGFTNPQFAMSGEWTQNQLLVTCLFGAVVGLAVNRNIALFVAAFAVAAQFLYLQVFRLDELSREQFLLSSVTMIGCLGVVYYYRRSLDGLVLELRRSIEQTRLLKEHAEEQEIENRPFAMFGRSTAGLVHDFRNDINPLSLAVQTLSLKVRRGRPLDVDDLDQIGRSIRNLQHRMDMVRFVTEAGQAAWVEDLDLRQVLESAVYPFRISPEVHGRIDIQCAFIGQLRLRGNRIDYLQLFENIIRNSCEALVERDGGQGGIIRVELARHGQYLELEFRDNAGGIPACFGCTRFNCLDCPSFSVGRTTKKYGSGMGMLNIFRVVRALNGRIKLHSEATGTRISVSLPVPEAANGTAPVIPG